MANINKELNQIKNAVYGKDVRGSIHDGIEKINNESEDSKQKADEAHDVMESIINDGFDNAALESNFEQKLDDKIENLQPDWTQFKDQTNSQLAENEDKFDGQNWELNSKSREKRGITLFESDDGRIEEFTVAKDIFSKYEVPQNIAIVDSWIGRENFCSEEQLLELQNVYGWEIVSHSLNHPANPPMIENPNDKEVEDELKLSLENLKARGFDVHNYSYPGGNYGKRERMFARKYYRSARNSDYTFFEGLNETPLNSYELNTIWLDPSTHSFSRYINEHGMSEAISMIKQDCFDLIDRASERNSVAIISTHFRYINTDELKQLYEDVILYARSKTLVTTRNDMLNRMGNIVDIGDMSKTGSREAGDNHYVVSVDGSISGSLSVFEEGKFDDSTPFVKFPLGVSVGPISSQELGEGTLINVKPFPHKTGSNRVNYGYQLFNSEKNRRPTLRRDATSNSNYSPWFSDNMIQFPENHNYDLATPFGDLPQGLTLSTVTSTDEHLNLAPYGRQGSRVTIKPHNGTTMARYGFEDYQAWGGDLAFRRRVTDTDEYGDWFLLNGVHPADQNTFDIMTPPREFTVGITTSVITVSNENINEMPEQSNGKIVTDRPSINLHPYITQTITPLGSNNYYRRSALDGDRWGRFKKYAGELL